MRPATSQALTLPSHTIPGQSDGAGGVLPNLVLSYKIEIESLAEIKKKA